MFEFKNMKFNIGYDKEVSKVIQERLFVLGYRWSMGGKRFRHTDKCFLFTGVTGKILSSNSGVVFSEDIGADIDIGWLCGEDLRSTVLIGGKHYFEDELAAALANLEEAKHD